MLPRRSPSVEGEPAERGEPDDWFPGGRGARGISRAKPERGTSRNREKNPKKGERPFRPLPLGCRSVTPGFPECSVPPAAAETAGP
jgi:hypothetical protein